MRASRTTGVRRRKRRVPFELTTLLSARLVAGTLFEAAFTTDVTLVGSIPDVDGFIVDGSFNLDGLVWVSQTGPRTITFTGASLQPDVSVIGFVPSPVLVTSVLGFVANMGVGVDLT